MKQRVHLKVDEQTVLPFQIIVEYRRNARASIGKKHIIIRLPSSASETEQHRIFQNLMSWVKSLYQKQPEKFSHFFPIHYEEGYQIQTWNQSFTVRPKPVPNENNISGKVKGSTIHISYPEKLKKPAHPKIGKLVSDLISTEQKPLIEEKLITLNNTHLKEDIQKVRIRHMASRWGSCNSSGNIGISSRALLAPEAILDHILMHELAHLKEMNHSKKFWSLVARMDPGYKTHHRWLKENGHKLRF